MTPFRSGFPAEFLILRRFWRLVCLFWGYFFLFVFYGFGVFWDGGFALVSFLFGWLFFVEERFQWGIWKSSEMLPLPSGLGGKLNLKTSLSERALGTLCRRLSALFLLVCVTAEISFPVLLLPWCWFHPYSDLWTFQ